MPRPGFRWRHVIVSTYRSWLPGDPRGFRSRGHKIHSTGDYKTPPPIDEHAGLRHFHRSEEPKGVLSMEIREELGRKIVEKFEKLKLRVVAIAVAPTHSRWLVELPDDDAEDKRLVGEMDAISPHAIRKQIPGGIWARGAKLVAVDIEQNHRNVYDYILRQKDAWTWKYTTPQHEAPG